MSILLSLTAAALLAAKPQPDPGPGATSRFALNGTLMVAPAASPGGRYAVTASARLYLPDRVSTGRFSLKSGNQGAGGTSCSSTDDIFQNGFE